MKNYTHMLISLIFLIQSLGATTEQNYNEKNYFDLIKSEVKVMGLHVTKSVIIHTSCYAVGGFIQGYSGDQSLMTGMLGVAMCAPFGLVTGMASGVGGYVASRAAYRIGGQSGAYGGHFVGSVTLGILHYPTSWPEMVALAGVTTFAQTHAVIKYSSNTPVKK